MDDKEEETLSMAWVSAGGGRVRRARTATLSSGNQLPGNQAHGMDLGEQPCPGPKYKR